MGKWKEENEEMEEEVLKDTKEDFLTLCKGYNALGKFLGDLGPIIVPPCVAEKFQAVFLQYHEMGEQLKKVGFGLDAMGGEPIMGPSRNFPGRNPSVN